MSLLPCVQEFLNREHLLFIDGAWVPASGGATFDSINPANEQLLGRAARANTGDVDAAVDAARRALNKGPWARMTGAERARLLWRVGDLIDAHTEELAQLESLDQGKPLAVARSADVPGSAETFRYMAGWATKFTGATIPVGAPGDFQTYTVKEPVGVVGQIVPWNFPLAMAAWKLAPALAVGCTVILKPAENTPLSTVRLFELMEEAGFPKGVVNLLTGYGAEAGVAMVSHSGIDKIAFTGSTSVGKTIVAASANDLKRVSLELGGKNPTIVCPDADLTKALPGIVQAAFGNSGQVCTAPSRAYVHRSVMAEVEDGLASLAQGLRVGPGLEEGTQLGPVVSQAQMESIIAHIQRSVSTGAEALTGGARLGNSGYFIPATVLTGTTHDMEINRNEIFGPVLTLVPYDDEDDVIAMANDSRYGLTAQVWTEGVRSANRFADELEFGSVWFNGKSMDIALPFGGLKESGWGSEKGEEGVMLYTRTRTIVYAL